MSALSAAHRLVELLIAIVEDEPAKEPAVVEILNGLHVAEDEPEVTRAWKVADAFFATLRVFPFEKMRNPVKAVHRTRDVHVEPFRPTGISCPSLMGVGCYGCCRGEVATSKAEAAYIAARLTPEQKQRVLAHNPSSPKTAWCPLLVAGRCSIYGNRPALCRAYHTVLPRENCFDDEEGIKPTALLTNEAYYELFDGYDEVLVPALKDAIMGGAR